jgi:hypothetical protein
MRLREKAKSAAIRSGAGVVGWIESAGPLRMEQRGSATIDEDYAVPNQQRTGGGIE